MKFECRPSFMLGQNAQQDHRRHGLLELRVCLADSCVDDFLG